MKSHSVLFVVLLIGSVICCWGNESFAAWSFERMVKDIESKLPIAQKQAEALVKMLNSEKHLSRIQKDIDVLKNIKTCQLRAKDTYLYQVMKQLELPLEKTAVYGKSLEASCDNYGGEASIQMLSPKFLFVLCSGTCQNQQTPILENKDFLSDPTNAGQLVSLCEKIQAIQYPVQLLAQEKLDVSGVETFCIDSKGGSFAFRGGKNFLSTTSGNNGGIVYSFLIPDEEGSIAPRRDWIENTYSAADLAYLNYLKLLLAYMEEIGYGFFNGTGDWGELIEDIDLVISQKAGRLDLEDLTSDSDTEKTSEGSKKEGNDLDIDDLKLPE